MSSIFSGTQQGRFTQTAGDPSKIIKLRSDLDWIRVYNLTKSYAVGSGAGVEYYWQRGMTQGRGTIYSKTNGGTTLNIGQIGANSGFYLLDSTLSLPGASTACTGVSADAVPRVTTAAPASLRTGDIVRIGNIPDAQQLGTLDFTVGDVQAGYFELAYMSQVVATGVVAGNYRRIPFDSLFYPRYRNISSITQASSGVIKMTVTHGFTVGQEVRLVIPEIFGMTELNGQAVTITDVDTVNNTITINRDTSGYTAFIFPISADAPFTAAQVVPIGQNTAESIQQNVNILADSSYNTGFLGIELMGGANSPAGESGDEIYWVAGNSANIFNQ